MFSKTRNLIIGPLKLWNILEYNLLTPIWIFISSVTSKTQRILEIMSVMQKCNKYIQVLHNLVILKFLMLINFQDENKKTLELICQVFCLLFFSSSRMLFFWGSVFCLRSIDRIIPHGNRICIILYRALSFTWETIKLPQTLSCMAVNQWVS